MLSVSVNAQRRGRQPQAIAPCLCPNSSGDLVATGTLQIFIRKMDLSQYHLLFKLVSLGFICSCPQWYLAPRVWVWGLGTGGQGLEAALLSSKVDTESGISPGLACGRVWEQRAQLQSQVFRQSVSSLRPRLVPHYKQLCTLC